MSLAEKLDIIKKHDLGANYSQIARDKNMGASSVRAICDRKAKIKAQAAVANPANSNSISIDRTRPLEKTEKLLCFWIQDLNQRGVPLGQSQICSKARELFLHVKENFEGKNEKEINQNFIASNGWWNRFKKRNEIESVKLVGEAKSADVEAAKKYPPILNEIIEKGNYSEHQIFNVDECGLWWKQPPSRSYIADSGQKNSKSSTKLYKDRCTLLLGSNASGSFRLKPYLIWRSKNPRPFKNAKKPLPVTYRSNKKSWMTATLWHEWFYKMAVPTMKVFCKESNLAFNCLLLVDNCPAHPFLPHENVKMIFLPPNTTSLLQPMDQGAISIMKTNFKYDLLNDAIKAVKKNLPFLDFLKGLNILDAVYMVEKAWKSVPESALYGVWNNVLTSRKDKDFEPEITDKVSQIVQAGKSLGIEDLDSESVIASLSIEAEALTNEDLLALDDELIDLNKESLDNELVNSNTTTNEDIEILEPDGLNKEKVAKIICCLNEARDIASEHDTEYDRSLTFANNLKIASMPYLEIQKLQLQHSQKQTEMSNYFNKAAPKNQGINDGQENQLKNKKTVHSFFDPKPSKGSAPKPSKGVAMQTLVIDIDEVTDMNDSNNSNDSRLDTEAAEAEAKLEAKALAEFDKKARLEKDELHCRAIAVNDDPEIIFRNDPDFLNESRLIIYSSCVDKNEAKYRCEECLDNLCDPCYKAHLVVKVTRNHTITDLPHRGTSPLPDGQMEAINRGIISNSPSD